MKKLLRWTGFLLGGLLVFLLLAGLALYLWQRGSLPQTEGEITLAGLTAPVEILRDQDGVPTIRAANEADALFALGFLHAQDRLFQMELMRRLGSGRLSEVVGEPTIKIDRLMRTLGLRHLAEAGLNNLSDPTKAALQAYSAGVNAFLTSHDGPWPLEFYVRSLEPEAWSPRDSLLWGKLMALQLSGNYQQELLGARLSKLLPADKLAQLFPGYPADAPVGTQDLTLRLEVLQQLATLLPWEYGPKDASNAWALGPSRSTTGGAVLANDPHLGLQAPGNWYLVRVEIPGLTWVGATAPGAPYLVLGHNGQVAWGFTTTHSDTQDIFIERVDNTDPSRYLTKEGAQPFKTREETIEVAGGAPITFTVRETYHGVVVSDLVTDSDDLVQEGEVLALAWPALRADDRSPEALYRLNHAENLPGAIAALRDLSAPQQTVLLADRDGRIALLAPGAVPIRLSGDGRLPVAGWDGAHDWKGWIPYEQLPLLTDPASGLLVAANNKLVPDDYPFLIAADWPSSTRAQRIADILQSKSAHALEDSLALQNDSLSLGAQALLPRLLAAPLTDLQKQLVAPLVGWDGTMQRDLAAPLIYSAWLRALERRLMEDELGALFSELWQGDGERVLRLLAEDSLWCDDQRTPEAEGCDQIITLALEDARSFLVARFGEDQAAWRWGAAHETRFDHPLFGFVPFLADLTAYPLETDGGQDTINRGGAIFAGNDDSAFRHVHGAGYRAVYDLANLDNSRFVIATGQSGNLLSPYYGSFAERWRDGLSIPLLAPTPEAAQVLKLLPLDQP